MTQGLRKRTSRAIRLGLGLTFGWLAGCTHTEKKPLARPVGPPQIGGLSPTPVGATPSPYNPATGTPTGRPGAAGAPPYGTSMPTPANYAPLPVSTPGTYNPRGQVNDGPQLGGSGAAMGVSPRPNNPASMTLQSRTTPGSLPALGGDPPVAMSADVPLAPPAAPGSAGPSVPVQPPVAGGNDVILPTPPSGIRMGSTVGLYGG